MNRRPLEVLGVYRLQVTPALLKRQMAELYPHLTGAQRNRARADCRRQLESVVLVETLLKACDERFDVCDFTQERDGAPRSTWQAAWNHRYLTADGETLLETQGFDVPRLKTFRCAFFLHFYQPAKTLRTSYGECNCPPVEDMPARLARLAPFTPVD